MIFEIYNQEQQKLCQFRFQLTETSKKIEEW